MPFCAWLVTWARTTGQPTNPFILENKTVKIVKILFTFTSSVQSSGRITFYVQRQKWTPFNYFQFLTHHNGAQKQICGIVLQLIWCQRTCKMEELKADDIPAVKNTTKEHWIKFWKISNFLSATRITFRDTNTEYWICFYMNKSHVLEKVLIAKQRYKYNASIVVSI